ncbi:phage portal protein [Pontivivens nitratireducens]|uniref:phage portal protein n=1 Tax=Pontivivens nitratireducens TaxID=2758038 RepID=UPI00163995F5|nr:phage portal protein [Pontibrevibacter nitratireducens]
MFNLFRKSQSAPVQKGLASPDEDMLALFGLVPSSPAGITISSDTALRVPAVGSAVRLISEAAATLDIAVKRKAADGTETIEAHPVADLLQGDANDWTGGFEIIRDLVIDALTDDKGGMVHVSRAGDGRVLELVRYRNGVIDVQFDESTGEPSYKINGRPEPAANIIHLRSPFGRSPLTLYRDAIATAVALDRHAGRLFGRGARPSGVLSFPKGMGEAAVKAARTAWRATQESEGDSGRTAILHDGASFTPLTLASTDAQFLENRQFQILEVARAFRVPPPMLAELGRATWANAEQQGLEFLSYTLEPWLVAIEGALRRGLFLEDERADLVVRFDRDDITRADLATRATVINSLISSRVLNPNEGRQWLGLAPYAGGEAFLNPNIATPTDTPDEVQTDAIE